MFVLTVDQKVVKFQNMTILLVVSFDCDILNFNFLEHDFMILFSMTIHDNLGQISFWLLLKWWSYFVSLRFSENKYRQNIS